MGANKNWSADDIEYLSERWGTKPIPAIARDLGRTENAVVVKAAKLKLGPFLESGNYITLNNLYKALGGSNGNSYTVNVWCNKLGLPVTKKTVRNCSFKVIKIDRFWKWAKENQARLDFSEFPKNLLGHEPDWVEDKRKHDQIRSYAISKSAKSIKWTDYEDNLLLSLLKSYKYTTNEIAERLCRSEGAVIRRISDLGIKYRPLRNSPHTAWTINEIQVLCSMTENGGNYTSIRREIPRHSEKAIRGYVYRTYGTENLDKVREIIKNERQATQ